MLIIVEFFKFIAGIFIGVGTGIASALATIGPILLSMWSTLMAVFKTVAGLFVRLGRHVYRFVEPVWTRVLRPVVDVLADFWERFTGLLTRVIDPILSRLQWIYDLFIGVYERFVVPILDWIERVRLILSGLGLLGIGWAQSLAGILGQVEEKINDAFRVVEEYLREVARILNQFFSPGGYLRRQATLLTVQMWGGGIMSIIVGLGIDPDLGLRTQRTRETAEIPTLPIVQGDWIGLVIREHPAVRAIVDDFRQGRLRAGEASAPR